MSNSPIRNVSDTARWAAFYRARETERADAIFKDPFARRLAGDKGELIAKVVTFSTRNSWSWIARTDLFDQFIAAKLLEGADMVINLAAGLDARPYRMSLSPSLKWVEIDLPEIVEYKTAILAKETPVCSLERITLDLSNAASRKEVLQHLAQQATNVLILSEGLLIYFTEGEVTSLADDLAALKSIQSWIMDLASPGLLKLMKKKMGAQMGPGAVLRFAPAEGPAFFENHGWQVKETRSLLKAAARLKRLPLFLKLMSPLTPEVPTIKESSRPWSGVSLLEKKVTSG